MTFGHGIMGDEEYADTLQGNRESDAQDAERSENSDCYISESDFDDILDDQFGDDEDDVDDDLDGYF